MFRLDLLPVDINNVGCWFRYASNFLEKRFLIFYFMRTLAKKTRSTDSLGIPVWHTSLFTIFIVFGFTSDLAMFSFKPFSIFWLLSTAYTRPLSPVISAIGIVKKPGPQPKSATIIPSVTPALLGRFRDHAIAFFRWTLKI